MKTRTVVLVIVLVLAASMSLAGKKISVDDLYGTWVNSDYNNHALNPGKQIKPVQY